MPTKKKNSNVPLQDISIQYAQYIDQTYIGFYSRLDNCPFKYVMIDILTPR